MDAFEYFTNETDWAARVVPIGYLNENNVIRNGSVQAIWRDENIAGRRTVLRRDESESLGVDTDGAADQRKRLPRDKTAAVLFHKRAVVDE